MSGLTFLIVCIFALFRLIYGEDLYVSPVHQGDACDQFFPCSFQTALSRAEGNEESDTIYVSPGTYLIGNTLEVNVSDKERLTIKPLDPDKMPVLDGGGNLRIMKVSFVETQVTIEGLVFQNGNAGSEDGGALYVSGEATVAFFLRNSTFISNTARKGGAVFVTNTVGKVFIPGNRFEGNTSYGEGSALYTPCFSYSSLDFALIERNTFLNNLGDSTVYLNASGNNCSFTGNLLANNSSVNMPYGVLYMDVSGKAHVVNNTIYGSDMVGIYARLSDQNAEINLYNNIVWKTGETAFAGKSLTVLANSGRLRIFNNFMGQAFLLDPDADGTSDDTVVSEGVYLKDTSASMYSYNANLFTDPKFVNPQGGDFRLQGTSPAIDSGTSDLPAGAYLGTKDIDTNPREVDGNADEIPVVDRGAFEYNPLGVGTGGCTSASLSPLGLLLLLILLTKRFIR
ncbi:putative outer membrane repeat protein [Hydrogenivirga caldilitoris]|uniref:Putative outer membrane repeat protein n=1 Tax=Hydrogenivirga caldilitoris TaxID=246264 RepID=A0A497XSF3_9AQUI|nr:right-handed parallel beta-helix repeat-containing protein [Hydrogenivirga caldilitoris]RLJ71224.1 putative outer membrane repeat protein [Hydrogenivirga caldilitoris]